MKIQIEPHTLQRANQRGASEEEIKETLLNGNAISAKNNRLGKSKVFLFDSERNGKFYKEKKIEVYYVIENQTIIQLLLMFFSGTLRSERLINKLFLYANSLQ